MQPRATRLVPFRKWPAPSSLGWWNKPASFLFPWPCGLIYRGPPYFCLKVIGAAVLKMSDRPAIRAVLWEGVLTLSDSDAKPSHENNQSGSGKSGAGKGGRGRRSSGSDVGNALRAAYHDTLKEEVPADLLALLGKLD